MNYKVKRAAVKRFERSMNTAVLRFYTDDVGAVRHTPRTYYRVMKRNLRERKAKFKRRELYHFAKVAFLVANTPDLKRRGVEVVFGQIMTHAFLVDLLLDGFTVGASAVKKVLAAIKDLVKQVRLVWNALFSRRTDHHLYLTLLKLLF